MSDALSLTLADAVMAGDATLGADVVPAIGEATPLPSRSARYVQFVVGDTHYAVPQPFVIELDRVPKITVVPQAPPWLRGVTNRRGDVLSVIDVGRFIGLDAISEQTGRLLVTRLLDEDFSAGLLVDAVNQIITLELDAIRPPASPLEGPLAPFLAGISVAAEHLVAVLDLERLLRSTEIRQFDEVKEDPSCEAR